MSEKELSIRAKNVLRDANLKTKEQVEKYHKKNSLTSLRNCGYVLANEICAFYGLPPVRTHCPECKQELNTRASQLEPPKLCKCVNDGAITVRKINEDFHSCTCCGGLQPIGWSKLEPLDYAISLQRAIEYHSRNKIVPKEIADNCPHHANMLNKTIGTRKVTAEEILNIINNPTCNDYPTKDGTPVSCYNWDKNFIGKQQLSKAIADYVNGEGYAK